MNISVELTLTPIQDDFEPAIINLIKKLRASGLTVMENPLSTQVYGDYDKVMEVLHREIKEAFLGRPIQSIADDVDFWYRAGYDYIHIRAGYEYRMLGDEDTFANKAPAITAHAGELTMTE